MRSGPRTVSIFVLLALAMTPVERSVAQDDFRFTGLGVMGRRHSFGFGINDHGDVVGLTRGYFPPHTLSEIERGFVYSNGVMIDIPTLGGRDNNAVSINDAGQITGWSRLQLHTQIRAYVYSDGTLTNLGSFGSGNSNGVSINNSGHVAGNGVRIDLNQDRGFLYTTGPLIDLGTLDGKTTTAQGMNDLGQIVGSSRVTGPEVESGHGFLYENGTMIDLNIAGTSTGAFAINNRGQITGNTKPDPDHRVVYRYENGTTTILDTLGGRQAATGGGDSINELGMIVGRSYLAGETVEHAFLFTDQRGVVDLNDYVPAPAGWRLESATAINNHGQITGYGVHGETFEGFLLTPDLHWQTGVSGHWDDPGAWSWGLKPGHPHAVYINNSSSDPLVVTGTAAETRVSELHIGTTGTGVVTLQMNGGITVSQLAHIGVQGIVQGQLTLNTGSDFHAELRRDVRAGDSYAGITSATNTTNATEAIIAAGFNLSGDTQSVRMRWRNPDDELLQDNQFMISDILELTGMTGGFNEAGRTDPYLLQMSYNAALINGDEVFRARRGEIQLSWLDESQQVWLNSIDGNFGGLSQFAGLGAWSDIGVPGVEDELGRWGIDTDTDTVWAVLDHNSQFAVNAIPEPSAIWMLAAAVGVVATVELRGRRAVSRVQTAATSDT